MVPSAISCEQKWGCKNEPTRPGTLGQKQPRAGGIRDTEMLRKMTLKELSKSEPIPFSCPVCEAEYKMVTIEACHLQRGKTSCMRCGFPFSRKRGDR